MNLQSNASVFSRRQALQAGTSAFGSLAMAALLGERSAATEAKSLLAPQATHHRPTAKRVIFMFINGGPSQHDLFDYKPELKRRDGQEGRQKNRQLFGSPWKFARHGEGGVWMSELLPHLAKEADHLCVIRSMQTDSSAHPLAIPLLHTGSFQFQRPSLGSWVLYGLGTDNADLPGFITINPTRTFGGPSNYGSAFLPTAYQATRIGFQGQRLRDAEIKHLSREGAPGEIVRSQLDLVQAMNRDLLERTGEEEIGGVLNSAALSARMSAAIPRAMNLDQESQATLDAYGVNQKRTDNFGRQCLLARRFLEAGVRFVELSHHGWDHHTNLERLADRCEDIDQPIAALIADLAARGMLEDTLLVWAGEFGRRPDAQYLDGQEKPGRDHNSQGYTAWLAGGGVRGGLNYGQTDELGYEAVENKVHLYDLFATILHCLGLDHTRLTYHYGGRDFRLTDVHGRVVRDVLS